MRPGETLFFAEAGITAEHLYVVLSGIDASGRIAVVNFTTVRRGADLTCTIAPGDHPFIRHQSCIQYKSGMLIDSGRLDDLLTSKPQLRHAAVSPELLLRIQQGALISQFTISGVAAAVRRTLGM